MHELGHHAEWRNSEIYEVARSWRDARGRHAHGRVRTEMLKVKKQNSYVGPAETAVSDHFFDAYVGRVYPYRSTEVFTTGIELFHSPKRMLMMYESDPEQFLLIAGMIAP